MDSEELLAQLADIHLPEPVSFWPPAPGWWVLALLLLVACIYLIRRLQQARTRRKICDYALAELDKCYEQIANNADSDLDAAKLRYVNEVNSVLRRVALVHFPHSNVASLGGVAWVDFIRQKGDSSLLNEELTAVLSHGRFQTKCDVDTEALNALGHAWVKSLYLQPKQRESDSEANASSGDKKDQPIHA